MHLAENRDFSRGHWAILNEDLSAALASYRHRHVVVARPILNARFFTEPGFFLLRQLLIGDRRLHTRGEREEKNK